LYPEARHFRASTALVLVQHLPYCFDPSAVLMRPSRLVVPDEDRCLLRQRLPSPGEKKRKDPQEIFTRCGLFDTEYAKSIYFPISKKRMSSVFGCRKEFLYLHPMRGNLRTAGWAAPMILIPNWCCLEPIFDILDGLLMRFRTNGQSLSTAGCRRMIMLILDAQMTWLICMYHLAWHPGPGGLLPQPDEGDFRLSRLGSCGCKENLTEPEIWAGADFGQQPLFHTISSNKSRF
jgi:hypothetical protein